MSSTFQTIPDTMRAVLLSGAGWQNLHVETVPVPRPNENQLLAKVDCAGVCTSLLKIVKQGGEHPLMYGRNLKQYPVILGDEGAITIIEVGEKLKDRIQIGERFVLQPSVVHSPINFLKTYPNLGRGIVKLGSGYTLPGQLAEFILITEEEINAKCLIKISDNNVPFSHAALTEPLSCCISAQERHIHLSVEDLISRRSIVHGLMPGGVLVIVGAGMMGRMHLDVALSQPVRSIVVSDPIESRLDIIAKLFSPRAEKLGINLILVNPNHGDIRELVMNLTNGMGADDVIVAVGNKTAIETSQTLLGRGGTYNLFGGLPKSESLVVLDSHLIHYLETTIVGSSGGIPWDMKHALDLITHKDVDPALHITNVADLSHVPELLEMMSKNQLSGKAIVYPHRRTIEIHHVQNWTQKDELNFLLGA